MQTKRERSQQAMLLLPSLESFLPHDHYLYRLNRVLDLGFVHEAVRDRYCQDNGRPSIDPEVIIRLFLVQAMDGIAHVGELMRQVQVNLAYRWFIGYDLGESLPDHSTLSKALSRFGDEVFDELFERSIAQCQASGLVEGRVLHVDATTIRADLDRDRVNKPDSPDPDARYGHFPCGQIKPGYKQHTVADGKRRVVLGVTVTSADRSEHAEAVPVVDEAIKRLEEPPEVVCGDAAYASGKNASAMESRGVRLVSPPGKLRTHTGDAYFTVEDFEYDEKADEFVCPAGNRLHYVGPVKGRPDRCRYQASVWICRDCELKSRCTQSAKRQLKVSRYHASMVRLRADSKTEDFKKLYATRAPVIEGVFAEAKQWHGLGRAWRRGLSKMRVQCLLVASVLNFKRLMAAHGPLLALRHIFGTLLEYLRRYLSDIKRRRFVFGKPRPIFG
jgi:transposase